MKRPKKTDVVAVLTTQYLMYKEGVPGTGVEQASELANKGYFLYESEVEDVINKRKKDIGDPEDFARFLYEAGAIEEGEPPKSVERTTRIDSRERALEVANEPDNEEQVQTIMELMSKIIDIRNELNKHINKRASLSVALKNKKPTDKSPEENTESES